MRFPCIFACLACLGQLAFAQTATPPALAKPDPQIQAIIDAGNKLMKSREYEKAAAIFQQAADKAKTLNDAPGGATADEKCGVANYYLGHLQTALDLWRAAEQLYVAYGNREDAVG